MKEREIERAGGGFQIDLVKASLRLPRLAVRIRALDISQLCLP
jgi:hypothetical protein